MRSRIFDVFHTCSSIRTGEVRKLCQTHVTNTTNEKQISLLGGRGMGRVTTATKGLQSIEAVKEKQTAVRGEGGRPDPCAKKTENCQKNWSLTEYPGICVLIWILIYVLCLQSVLSSALHLHVAFSCV